MIYYTKSKALYSLDHRSGRITYLGEVVGETAVGPTCVTAPSTEPPWLLDGPAIDDPDWAHLFDQRSDRRGNEPQVYKLDLKSTDWRDCLIRKLLDTYTGSQLWEGKP
jgi:hypothetical protein